MVNIICSPSKNLPDTFDTVIELLAVPAAIAIPLAPLSLPSIVIDFGHVAYSFNSTVLNNCTSNKCKSNSVELSLYFASDNAKLYTFADPTTELLIPLCKSILDPCVGLPLTSCTTSLFPNLNVNDCSINSSAKNLALGQSIISPCVENSYPFTYAVPGDILRAVISSFGSLPSLVTSFSK